MPDNTAIDEILADHLDNWPKELPEAIKALINSEKQAMLERLKAEIADVIGADVIWIQEVIDQELAELKTLRGGK
jgi:dihydroneopterin aldolase